MNTWFKEIDLATTEAELVSNARDIAPSCILATSPPFRWSAGVRIENDSDIARLREKLAKGYAGVRSHASEVEKLRDLVSYLSKVTERLGEIRSR